MIQLKVEALLEWKMEMNNTLNIFNIKNKAVELVNKCEMELINIYDNIDRDVFFNSCKVLSAFKEFDIKESDFFGTTGYGYGDIGRDTIESVFALSSDIPSTTAVTSSFNVATV